ncbi:MAG: hypothetical protein ACM31C_21375 [Acidobacteriota bacterium]
MSKRAVVAVLLALGASASADPSEHSPFEGEIGLGVDYTTSDFAGLGLFTGFSLAKPILGACYLEPLVEFEIDFTLSSRITGMLRCNFITGVGSQISLGVGAGFGNHAGQDMDGNMTSTPMNFREVELAMKLGGKRRFLIGVALAFDGTTSGADAVVLQTTLVRAMP